MATQIFLELTIIFLITLIISGFVRILKQPLVIGYILSGIIVGPFFLNLMKSADAMSAFSQIGVAFLLFMVGINLNPFVIKSIGKVSLITGVGQVLFTSFFGFFISRALGFSVLVSVYIAVALTFSSTIIIMKLLSDRNDLETLYGRIAIGFLIVQDLIAIFILIVLSSLSSKLSWFELISSSVLKGVAAVIILYIISIYILPKLTKVVAKSQEFLLLFSVSWCFLIASLFHFLNFSLEAGALLAGIALSMSPYNFEISSKMKPLRDFFLILFFILLGSQLVFGNIQAYLPAIIICSLFIIIGNPLVVLTIMGLMGYTKRTSFMAGLTVAQISEFSLVLIALGVRIGHLSIEILSLLTFIGLITFTTSTYAIMYSDKIYPFISKYLSIFEKKGKKIDEHKYFKSQNYEIILFGYNRIGFDVLNSLKSIKKKFLVIDYNPDVIIQLAKEGYDCKYGDANDFEMLNELNLSQTKMIISTIPSLESNILLLNKINEANKDIITIFVSYQIDEAMKLYESKATYVIMPHFLGGKHISTMIENHKTNFHKFLKEKISHIYYLNERKKAGQEHPVNERNR